MSDTLKLNPFVGFRLGGIHSSTYNIMRVSNGTRYEESLLPNINEHTAQLSGKNSTDYFGSEYTHKTIELSLAFDNLTELNFREFRVWLGDMSVRQLIFDESPYKYYMVKLNNAPNIDYICFTENGANIYKGECQISLTAFYPFAKSVHKYLNEYENEEKIFLNDWRAVSMLRENKIISEQQSLDTYNGNHIYVMNNGDFDCDWRLTIPFVGENTIIKLTSIIGENGQLIFNSPITRINTNDKAIRINTRNNLLEGIGSDGKLTGSVYNQYVQSGFFFKILKRHESTQDIEINFDSGYTPESETQKIIIDYEYIYY